MYNQQKDRNVAQNRTKNLFRATLRYSLFLVHLCSISLQAQKEELNSKETWGGGGREEEKSRFFFRGKMVEGFDYKQILEIFVL